jgi:hypothetical protein
VGDPDSYVAEVVLKIDNNGQREHRLADLWCEVRQSRSLVGDKLTSYLPLKNLKPEDVGDFYIPANSFERFPKTFRIPRSERLVRVMATYSCDGKPLKLDHQQHLTFEVLDALSAKGADSHTVARLFSVPLHVDA